MPDDPQKPDSLGDDRTFAGEPDVPVEEQQSLGDAGTHADGLDSSISNLELDGQVSDSDLPLIDLAARFEIEGELGKGGMGAVQLATDRQLKRKVAIKRIHASSPAALRRFVTEARSIAALNHFNIVQVHEFERDEEGPFLVLEYVSGGSLLDRLKDGKLEVEDAIGITCQLCDALTLAHGKGIIHRDIKPANILLTEEGVPKLTDFGLARQESVDHGQTQEGAVLGTIDFMPPEQRRDATSVDARSDLWSLAATLYQMLTGEVPRVIDLDAVPQNLRSTFATALKQNPDERFSSAEQFKTELRKGMTMAVPDVATPVAPDLVAGVCPSCNTANETSRKFCRGCRAPLIEPCLSCEKDNPVWEDVCGECGSSQQEERDLVREKLAAVIEDSLTLAGAHEYEKALLQLNTVQEDQRAITEDLRGQAAEKMKLVTAERDEQYQRRDQSVQLANQHQQAGDYVAAVRELKKIPSSLYTDAIVFQLSKITAIISVKLEETAVESAVTLQGHSNTVKSVSFSPDGSRIVSGSWDTTVRVWGAETGQLAFTLKGHSDSVNSVAFSPDGKRIASGSDDTTVKVWDAETGQEMLSLKGHSESVNSVAFSLDGSRIVSGSDDMTLKVWDAETGQETLTLQGHSKSVHGVAFSPDGSRIVSGSFDNTVKVWDTQTGQLALTLEGHSYPVSSVSFSPDGKQIVSGSYDNMLKVWNAETGKETLTFGGHADNVMSGSFSPDGKRIASGSWDNMVKIWDAETGQEILRLKGHSGSVDGVAFSPDGTRIVSGSSDKTVKVWDISPLTAGEGG
jgi:serine/threonine protein kinase